MLMFHVLLFSSILRPPLLFSFFFFNDTATTEIYTLSLHDALPISAAIQVSKPVTALQEEAVSYQVRKSSRSEEHTSELQSHLNLVCRLLLEKKKKNTINSAENLSTYTWNRNRDEI